MIQVEVVYGTCEQHYLLSVEVPPQTTAAVAIQKSGILSQCPELNLHELIIGIFSKTCSMDTILQPGDRVEIYRPLIIDPKEARRVKAKKRC